MSSATELLGSRTVLVRRRGGASAKADRRPLIRVGAFAALALYGALRWGTLFNSAPTGKLVALVAVAVALAAIGPWLGSYSRVPAVLLACAAAIAMLAICGLPWTWIRHVRIAVSARAVGDGLQALPRLLVPYKGLNEWVRMVLLLGAGVLLFDGALMMAFAMERPRGAQEPEEGSGDLRRAVAALPLIALAAVPLTLVPSKFPYVSGLLLFGLLAVMVWGERLPRGRRAAATLACALVAPVAMVLAPALDAHKPWFNYETLAGAIAVGPQEEFDWAQHYGPLNWPRTGRVVLEVQAAHADYWKAENLDTFNGTAWAAGDGPALGGSYVYPSALARWTQTITVTVRAMKTSDVIGPGDLSTPEHATEFMSPDPSPGRWSSIVPMGPGDTYEVAAYSPHPSPSELAEAGTDYPADVVSLELAVNLPSIRLTGGPELPASTVWSDAFGSPAPHIVESSIGGDGIRLLELSPYAQAYELAQRLRRESATPYAFVLRVLKYLQHGFVYDENPRVSTYPLETFLFKTHRGYCQQFAGSMALLLRLGGVPARVAVGFTPGQDDTSIRRYLVTDFDAHAWVEVFFPHYGWVRFDPTPASDPALAPPTQRGLLASGSSSALPPSKQGRHALLTPGSSGRSGAGGASHRAGSGTGLVLPGLALLLALAVAVTLLTLRRGTPHTPEEMLAELERAFARSGRPLAPETTLAELAHRFHDAPAAEAYVEAISRARFAGGPLPGSHERRMVRAQLRAGLGASGALRALWALPPRPRRRGGPDQD